MSVTISLYVGDGKYWWTYLAIKSNPGLISGLDSGIERAIFFDESQMPPEQEMTGDGSDRVYFQIFWDGVTDYILLDEAQDRLGAQKKQKALVVGDFNPIAGGRYEVESFYANGVLRYDTPELRFDKRTKGKLRVARLKTMLMPMKNLLQGGKSVGPLLALLFGSKRIVFCGSYGTIPKVMEAFCKRRGIDFRLFDSYAYYGSDPVQTLESYRRYVDLDGAFLADLYRRGQIDATFFLSMVHLLGREYFIERIRAEGMKIFANGYSTGININVYTTPFYGRHVFLDFGSVVGTGNYPRLADLAYFRKKTLNINLKGDAEKLAGMATGCLLNTHFDALWDQHVRQLEDSMR